MVDNVEFPLVVSYGTIGGPGFATQIVVARSGSEGRNATLQQPRRKWNADVLSLTRDQFPSILNFWLARQGRLRGFRWQDPYDYWAVTQPLASIAGSTSMQLTMTYPDAVNPTVRTITRPVQNTTTEKAYTGIELFLTRSGTTEQLIEGTDYTVDYTTGTGIVTLAYPAEAGYVYTWTGQFDCAVRFDVDEPKFEENNLSDLGWKGFALIEILEPES